MKKFGLVVSLLASSMGWALPSGGMFNCSDLRGKNPMHIRVNVAIHGPQLVTITRPGKAAVVLKASRVEMSEEEQGEFSVWFLDESGNRRQNSPDTYCVEYGAQG